MDLLLRDMLGSLFACHMESRLLMKIYDMLLCYSAEFIPFVAAGFLKAGWFRGPFKNCKTVAEVRAALASRDKMNNEVRGPSLLALSLLSAAPPPPQKLTLRPACHYLLEIAS